MKNESTNKERADRIVGVLNTYCLTLEGREFNDDDSDITDLLTDIMHFCNQNGYNFIEMHNMAVINFLSEITTSQPDREDIIASINVKAKSGKIEQLKSLKLINQNLYRHLHEMSREKSNLRIDLVKCLEACKASVNALNQISNKKIAGNYKDTYTLCSDLDKIIAGVDQNIQNVHKEL